MGVYIKGFKMPEGGYRTIEIAYDADGHPMAITDGGDVFDVIFVSPHGRLGDLDALLKKCEFVCTDDDEDTRAVRYSIIEDAPTIIPAEEGET